jgi:hypothetical protein
VRNAPQARFRLVQSVQFRCPHGGVGPPLSLFLDRSITVVDGSGTAGWTVARRSGHSKNLAEPC